MQPPAIYINNTEASVGNIFPNLRRIFLKSTADSFASLTQVSCVCVSAWVYTCVLKEILRRWTVKLKLILINK